MIDKNLAETAIDNFNMRLDMAKNEIEKEDGSFNFSVASLMNSRYCIEALEKIITQMKQEEHDLTQDVYNRFKDKGYVKTIKF